MSCVGCAALVALLLGAACLSFCQDAEKVGIEGICGISEGVGNSRGACVRSCGLLGVLADIDPCANVRCRM